jgi:hypothetical protein
MEQEAIEMQIWDFIDGRCSPAERAFVQAQIESLPSWKAAYAEITAFQQLLAEDLQADAPSMRFTKNVMEQIATTPIAAPAGAFLSSPIIKGLAAFFVLSLVVFVVGVLFLVNWEATSTRTISLPQITTYKISDLFNNDTIWYGVGINIVLAIVLAEMVLRKKMREG